jgi:acetyltransferase-like isoleucine patch superfamily enzyme
VPDLTKLKRGLRLAAHMALAVAPRAVKVPVYRKLFGFQIDPSAKIGLSVLDVDHLELGPGASIGHGNLLTRTHKVTLDEGGEIGYLNIVRGGEEVRLGAYSTVMRFNVLNSIPDNDAAGQTDARLLVDSGSFIVSGHRLDFTDQISIGKNVILAGRNSSFWTHNRQATRPIKIGDFCYVGSEVRMGPGAALGDLSILGMGAVLTGEAKSRSVLGGVPAKPIREVNEADEAVLRKKTKPSIPDDLY